MPKRVPSFGPLSAKVAVVGEAPGEQEEQLGRPFVGKSGGLLRTMLSDAGIVPEMCRFMNVMEFRPQHNDFSHFYHDKDRTSPTVELEFGRARLREEIAALRPNITIALGNEALKALTGKSGMDKWRGTVFNIPLLGKVVATFHPSYILRSYEERPIAQIDLCRARGESLSPIYKGAEVRPLLDPSFGQTMEWLLSHQDCEYCAFDTETLGKFIRCIGFATSPDSAICIPLYCVNRRNQKSTTTVHLSEPQNDNPSRWTPQEERAILDQIQKFFFSSKTKFIAQNFSFDISVLEENLGLRIGSYWFDTMHGHHLVYPEFPMNLDFLTSVYTYLGYYSDYDASNDHETWKYNTMDCIATYQSAFKILQELREFGMEDFYFRITHPLMLALTKVQNRGVLIDLPNREKLAEPLRARIEELRKRFESAYGMKVKKQPSPKQIIEFLNASGLPVPSRKGKTVTDARAMDDLIARHPENPFFSDVVAIRESVKFYGTYVQAPLDPDGRMRTSYNVSGTRTGRISSSKTLWGTGGNLQNIPKDSFRRVFIVPEGKVFMHADLSQAESRLVAWLSRDLELIERFIHDPTFDVHRFNAARIFKIPETEVTPDQRQKGKACNHSGNYGISWKKFSYISKIPYAEAKVILEKHQANPFLRGWWESIQLQLKTNRTIATPKPFARKRVFYGRLDDDLYREAYNFVPQSTVGDIINVACIDLDRLLNSEDGRIILQVHDEIDLEVDEKRVQEVKYLVRQALEIPILVYDDLPPLYIPVEITTGKNWYDQK